MDTLLLDLDNWNLVVDANGDIAVASNPYSQAQDAASAIRTWLGEVYYDTTLGVNYEQILFQFPTMAVLKQQMIDAALTVPGVVSAKIAILAFQNREITGQVQIFNEDGETAISSF